MKRKHSRIGVSLAGNPSLRLRWLLLVTLLEGKRRSKKRFKMPLRLSVRKERGQFVSPKGTCGLRLGDICKKRTPMRTRSSFASFAKKSCRLKFKMATTLKPQNASGI